MSIREAAERLSKERKYLFFLVEQRFRNPLIPEQYDAIERAGLFEDPKMAELIVETIPSRSLDLPAGIYFPMPILRTPLKEGQTIRDLFDKFSYRLIEVDEQRNWFWKGKDLTGRIKNHFLQNLRYESALDLFYVEYWAENRFDKCYLDCAITPMEALRIEAWSGVDIQVTLNNGESDSLKMETFKLNAAERLFCATANNGEVELADNPRFSLLEKVDESGDGLIVAGKTYSLTSR